MIDSKKNKNNKKYRGGSPGAYIDYIQENNSIKFTEITQEMVNRYGYPQKYIGYDVAIPPAGVERPFTFLEICEMAWMSRDNSIDYKNISSDENKLIVNNQIEKDMNRNMILMNGHPVKTESDYIQYINEKLQSANVTSDDAVLIKSVMNQFPLSATGDIMSYMLPKYDGQQLFIEPLNSVLLILYQTKFRNINNNIVINTDITDITDGNKVIGKKVIIDESRFTGLLIYTEVLNNPIQNVGAAHTIFYCDVSANKGFFIWKFEKNPNLPEPLSESELVGNDDEGAGLLNESTSSAVAAGENVGAPLSYSKIAKIVVPLAVIGTGAGLFLAKYVFAAAALAGGKTRKNKKNKKNHGGGKVNGGKVTGSGGFGCIFNPALKCKNKTMKSQKSKASGQEQNQITKLMKKKYATKEYQDIVKFQQKLQSVPNYTDYFLLQGFSICNPDILSDSDLENFDKKCSALKKMDITRENVNSSLDRLSAINMPYGGIDVGDYIIKVDLNGLKMAQLNDALINLLLKGIVPMNKKHVYHVDIKDSNVLVDDTGDHKHLYARLIDWGLSASYDGEKQVPKTMRNRPFQFNIPFSSILFNSLFTKMYADFLKKNPNPSYISIRTFVINYVVAWIAKRGSGHLKNINEVFKKFFDEELKNVNIDESYKNNLIIFDYTFYFIFEYITQILFKFTKNNQMNLMDYFSNVYVKNIDIWGFVMIYLPIMEQLHNNYDKLNEAEKQIIQEIKKMIMFILAASTTPINVDKLVEQLKVLNGLFIKSHKHNNVLWNMGLGQGLGNGRGIGNRKQKNSQFSYTTNMVSTTTTSSSSTPPFSRKREKVKRSKTRKRHNRK